MLKRSGPKKLKSIIENYALKCMKNKISKNEIRLILNWRNISRERNSRVYKTEKDLICTEYKFGCIASGSNKWQQSIGNSAYDFSYNRKNYDIFWL